QGQTKTSAARGVSRNKIPVNSLGLEIRATSWPSFNPPKSWFRQHSKAPKDKRNQRLPGRASRNKIPVNSLGLKIRATSCPSLNHTNHSSDNKRRWTEDGGRYGNKYPQSENGAEV
ncbi:MAG: hypothetical protein KBC60_13310, partial [Haliscomenobacter sp.]|nr:hypothetical protein [Haliscomenobacter sp.]